MARHLFHDERGLHPRRAGARAGARNGSPGRAESRSPQRGPFGVRPRRDRERGRRSRSATAKLVKQQHLTRTSTRSDGAGGNHGAVPADPEGLRSAERFLRRRSPVDDPRLDGGDRFGRRPRISPFCGGGSGFLLRARLVWKPLRLAFVLPHAPDAVDLAVVAGSRRRTRRSRSSPTRPARLDVVGARDPEAADGVDPFALDHAVEELQAEVLAEAATTFEPVTRPRSRREVRSPVLGCLAGSDIAWIAHS